MNFFLTNEHRKYMGLKPLKANYDMVEFKRNEYNKFYIFCDGNKIVKLIEIFKSDKYINLHERDINYETNDERRIVYPKTNRGKERKLTTSVVQSLEGEGTYFAIQKDLDAEYGNAIIANYTSQKTFYEDEYIENCSSFEDIKRWCDKYVNESTEQDLKDIQSFSKEKRKRNSYQEGDYFRVKLGRNKYTYGRILLDIYKGRKNKTLNYWDVVPTRPLIIEIFHILTSHKDIKIEELENLKTFPSQHIMDNEFYYGNYEIIGNGPLPEKIKYPIMYGKSISGLDPNKTIFQCGKIHIERPYEKDNYYGTFRNSSIGFTINPDARLIEKCLKDKSNNPYWEKFKIYDNDLRNPKNKDILIKILKDYNLEKLIELYKENN